MVAHADDFALAGLGLAGRFFGLGFDFGFRRRFGLLLRFGFGFRSARRFFLLILLAAIVARRFLPAATARFSIPLLSRPSSLPTR